MHRRGQSYADDSESLQADVMRFMAIIAFCLIAILALVKHAEPPVTTSKAEVPAVAVEPVRPEKTETIPPDPQPPQPQPQTEEPEPVEPAPFQPAPFQPAVEQFQLAAATPPTELSEPLPVVQETIAEVEPVPSQPVESPDLDPDPEPEAIPEVAAEPAPELPAAQSPSEPEEEGLILRFASDGDFLRLIARGDIRVYAFQNTDVLTLSESYRFLDTSSPGQVYELLPPSIPALIVDALKQARTDIDGYRWGIALPGHISNQIEQHLGRVRSGQLVIDRYGDVHHVAAS